jgi:hypothetical protein
MAEVPQMQEQFAAGRQHTGAAPGLAGRWNNSSGGVGRVLSLECADNNKP